MQRKIAIIGLGYVGLPVAMAFAKEFTGTVGFDTDQRRAEELTRGFDRTRELSEDDFRGLDIEFTSNSAHLAGANFFVVAVPTPVDEHHTPDLGALRQASVAVGKHLKPGAIVVYESTVYPGVTEDFCGPILEQESGLSRGKDFAIGYSPERINPGDKEHTLATIVKVVSGENEETLDEVAQIYQQIVPAGVHRAASIKVAEAAKVIENTQRDLNVALMNELAIIFERLGIRTKDVLDAAGTKWNFLKFFPGLVGGHCIGVDPYYLTTKAQQVGYHPEVILAGRRINDSMGTYIAQRTVKLMLDQGVRIKGSRVGVLGVTFKEDVSDIRNSRVPSIVSELTEYGIEALVHDPLAEPDMVQHEHGTTLSEWEKLCQLDALILAVNHEHYVCKGAAGLAELLTPQGVFVDVKSVFEEAQFPKNLVYWSL